MVVALPGDRGVSMNEVGRMIAAKGESDERRMERLENKMDSNMAVFVKMFESFQASQGSSGAGKENK